MSDDEVLRPYYDPARREAMRKSMVKDGFFPDLPIEALSDTQRLQIDNALMMEDHVAPYGGVEALLDSYAEEFRTEKAYSLEDFIKMLADYVAAHSDD